MGESENRKLRQEGRPVPTEKPVGGDLHAKRRILLLAPAYEPAVKAGGPVRSLVNLVAELQGDYVVDVITRDRDLGDLEPFVGLSGQTIVNGSVRIHYVNTGSPRAMLSLFVRLSRVPYDLMILNSVWHVNLSLVPALLRFAGILKVRQVLLMPRGELEDGARALKKRKKTLAMPVFRSVYRHSVDVVGATSDQERENVREWLPSKRQVLSAPKPDRIAFGSPDSLESTTRLMFLGRIHPTKGLLPLLRALLDVEDDVSLSIFGPISDERYWDACREVVRQLGNGVRVDYGGVAKREQVADLLHEHDALVSLTAGENFGHTIAESLQTGCSVVTTDKTLWTATLEGGGGWVVKNRDDRAEVAEVLSQISAMSFAQRGEQRVRAREAFLKWERDQPPNIVEQVFSPPEDASVRERHSVPCPPPLG